ncbi:YmfQ family protein [Chromobacterium rhizoryzae]|uniref:YmfQ family protein n=1 Tax=Chromobacterium rhizoryzae TaxID=1778675 RepID=UPI001D084317|nr:putative phage tail protein [Chromobacterium rhizoryzae]
MPAPNYSAADYLAAMQNLLPQGKAWPREPGAAQTQALSGLAPVYARQHARANNLLADAFPATAYELLPEWESTLGLPDPVLGMASTVQGRRQQVVAKLTAVGGQSAAYYQSLAAALGYSITVTNYAPFRCGQSSAGQPVGSQDWCHTWSVNSALNTIIRFSAGQSGAGEPLASWGNAPLQSQIQAAAPAHTVVQFHYS